MHYLDLYICTISSNEAVFSVYLTSQQREILSERSFSLLQIRKWKVSGIENGNLSKELEAD